MFVRSADLTHFRSWDRFAVDFDPGVTVLVGPNGHGKTNVLEAINYVSTLSSHRVSSDAPLVRTGCDSAVVRATVVNAGRELSVDVQINSGKANRARIGTSPVRRPREILGILNTVMFAPEDLALVRGDPGERRKYLDELATARLPRVAAIRSDYDRVLRQRAALLKTAGGALRRGTASADGSSALATLDVWDGQLAAYGAQLLDHRFRTVRDVGPHVASSYASIAPQSRPVSMSYRCSLGESLPLEFARPERESESDDVDVLEAAFLAELARVRTREIDRGLCLVGPHRDDLDLTLGTDPAKGFASHGESWSYALSLRLGAFDILRQEGTDPVLLLDDVFAELDRTRRRALAAVAATAEQVLVTAAVDDDIPAELSARRIGVRAREFEGGRVSELTVPSDAGSVGSRESKEGAQ